MRVFSEKRNRSSSDWMIVCEISNRSSENIKEVYIYIYIYIYIYVIRTVI